MPEEESRQYRMAEDVATLKVEFREMKERQKEQHNELMEEFRKLRAKVNDEITSIQCSVESNKKFYLRMLVITILIGSFIWIGESREWILRHLFNII